MDLEEQENELVALESILDPIFFKNTGNSSGEIKIEPFLKQPSIKVISPSYETQEVSENTPNKSTPEIHEVQFLPPIVLSFVLPPTYPSESPPLYVLSSAWLSKSQLLLLCDRMDEIWENQIGSVVLFEWHQFLQEDSLECLGIADAFEIPVQDELHSRKQNIESEKTLNFKINNQNKAVQEIKNVSEILPLLLTYNQTKKEKTFKLSMFNCQICFDTKMGMDCVQFKGCDHVYCKQCITTYFSIHIKDGDVKSLTCPAENCTAQPLPKQVQELAEPKLYERYEKLLLQTTLDTMDDIIYCPLSHCQSPVIVESESNIAQCPSCSFAFCPYCRLSYHGVSKCKTKSSEIQKLCEKYKTASDDEKQEMEKRYGRRALVNAIEEHESEEWLESNTRSCPSCHAKIEKVDGCNKITCYKCRAYFCWLCENRLDPSNPYRHFNTGNSPCFNRLFEGVVLDDEFDVWL